MLEQSVRRYMGLVGVLVLNCMVVSACISSSEGVEENTLDADAYRASRPDDIPEREYEVVQWEERLRLGGAEVNDTTLISPMQLAVSSDGVFLIDYYPRRIMSFSHDGVLRWQIGRKGGGPGEFQDPRDLRVGPNGHVWVMDPGNSRLTVFAPDGDSYRDVSLQKLESWPHAIVPSTNGEAILLVGAVRNEPFVKLDSAGEPRSRFEFPWDGYAKLNHLASQTVVANDPTTGRWVTAFALGDGFFTFQGDVWDGYHGWFLEHIAFPNVAVHREGNTTTTELVTRPANTAAHITLSPTRIYVLFGGATDERYRILDSFLIEDGSYVGSYLLPERVEEAVWHDGGIYTLRNAPYPELAYLKPQGEPLP